MIPLTGGALLGLCAGVTLALPILTIVAWQRVRGPRSGRAVQRVALLACCQLTAVLLVAIAMNDAFDFYGTWSSLLPSHQPAHVMTVPARPAAFGAVPAMRFEPGSLLRNPMSLAPTYLLHMT